MRHAGGQLAQRVQARHLAQPQQLFGPLARNVEDLALVLPVIQGVDWRDASVVPMPLADWRAVEVQAGRNSRG